MTVQNLTPQDIFRFIIGDFEAAWDSIAANSSDIARGNFMFAHQTMIMLEMASRLASGDSSGGALRDLSTALYQIEPRYFTRLPGQCARVNDFKLPYYSTEGDELLWALFDLIRNGQAHQYQQIIVSIPNRLSWAITLRNGPDYNRFLSKVAASPRHQKHLAYRKNQGTLWMLVDCGLMYLDIRNAISTSGLLSRGLTFDYFTRPRKTTKASQSFYDFDYTALEQSFVSGRHLRC